MVSMQSDSRSAQTPVISLTAHHLRFTVRAAEPIRFHDFKGSAIRGAFVGVLRRTFCPEWRAAETDPLHVCVCPVCQMLAAPRDEETSGDVRRPYAIRPPLDGPNVYAPGDAFAFTVTLFGATLVYLPYLVLTAGGMGALGVGRKNAEGRRGRFTVERIESPNPLTGQQVTLMEPGERMVQAVTAPVSGADVLATTETMLSLLAEQDNRLTVHFCTPTRLTTQGRHKIEKPDPFPLIKAAVLRVLDLCAQYGGGRPDIHLKQDIYPHADRVELVEDRTRWWDVKGYSGRLGRQQMLGGLVGRATYTAPDWRPLLPWLIWATQVQVGKNTVKGCGIVELAVGKWRVPRKEHRCRSFNI